MHAKIKLPCLMPLSQSATSYFRRWLTDDNDKWYNGLVVWCHTLLWCLAKKEKIKHKQTWMYQTLTRKWKFLLGSQLLQVCLTFTVCHHWCDIRSKLYLSESTFYSKTATQHTYFSAKVDFQIDSTVFLANSLSFRHTHTHAAWRHELNSPSHASWRSVCVSLVNKNKQHNTITTI